MSNPEFAASIHNQFDHALKSGVRTVGCVIPVVSTESNRITLGADARALPRAPHRLSLGRHPAGFIRVALESSHGQACPDPLPAIGLDMSQLPPNLTEDDPNVRRYSGIIVISQSDAYELLGAEFDGAYSPIRGVDESARDLFVAQLAGVALKHATATTAPR